MPLTGQVLMCAPTHFDVRYAINPWMNQAGTTPVNHLRAMQQWTNLKQVIDAHASVELIEPGADVPDMCFTANAGFMHGSTFVCSRFLHGERRGEEKYFWNWFQSRGYVCERLPGDIVFEGGGDALHDTNGGVWMGYGQRSSLASAQALRDLLGVDVIALQLVDPRFYHLDTCFCPLSEGSVLYFPGAFDARSLAKIEEHFVPSQRIAVTEPDALTFACNVVDLGKVVVSNTTGDEIREALEQRGIALHQVALDEFLKSGGAAKCLVLPLETPTSSVDVAQTHSSGTDANSLRANRLTA